MENRAALLIALTLSVALAACGGGADGNPDTSLPPASVPVTPPPPPPGPPPATTATLTVTTLAGSTIVQTGQAGQVAVVSTQEVRVVSSTDVSWGVSMSDGTVPLTTQILVDSRTWNVRINSTAGRTLVLTANSLLTPGLVVGTVQFTIQ
jgi:hypothetical protein